MTQQRIPASYRSLMAAVDVIVEEGAEVLLAQLQARHAKQHVDAGTEPSADCQACNLVGMAPQQQEGEPKE